VRREWPRRRAADQRDELAAVHSITSSARARSERAVVILATVLECADRAYGGRLQWVSEILNEVLLFSSLLALAGIVLAGML
jgi:hypothetical protein